jgi:hypothetical protein
MRFVLDRNFSELPALAEYLKAGNEIILSDDFLIEAYRSPSANSILYHNFKILKNFQDQIFMTFSRGELVRKELSLCKPIKSDQFINLYTTTTIRRLLGLDMVSLDRELTALKTEATNRIAYQDDFMERFIRNTAQEAFELIRTANELKAYRTNRNKRLNDIREVAFKVLELMLKDKGSGEYDLEQFKQHNSVIFSHNFIHLWRTIDWALKNGFQNATKSIQGDGFDIKYVLIGCFFDGILTKEEWLKQCREDTLSNFPLKTQ